MHEKRIWNIVLAVVAVLLLLNLGVMLSPSAHAIPKTQYKAVTPPMQNPADANAVQRELDQQSAQGWVYVDSVNYVLIFKR